MTYEYGNTFLMTAGLLNFLVILDACEVLEFQPRGKIESETYKYLGNMRSFGDTFESRIRAWVDDIRNKTPFDQVDAKAEDALKAADGD